MILSSITPQPNFLSSNNLFFFNNNNTYKFHSFSKPNYNQSPSNSLSATNSNSTSLQNPNNFLTTHNNNNHHHDENTEESLLPSASAVASAIRKASSSPVNFIQTVINNDRNSNLVLPSPDFHSLCLEQFGLFRRIVDRDALLSVYVRPAGSYVMDRLELRRVTGSNDADIVILIGNFSMPTGLRVAEAALSNHRVEVIPESRALVFPMVKHPFVVGFLVAELPLMEADNQERDFMLCLSPEETYTLPSTSDLKLSNVSMFTDVEVEACKFNADQRLNAIHIARSLAMAYVMDQKAMLLQQSSWQNNARMSNLVDQIRTPLSSIRTLSKMLSTQLKRSEIANDIVENILVQGDRMIDTLQQLQDAVYLTKANIMRYNEETCKKSPASSCLHPESEKPQLSDSTSMHASGSTSQNSGEQLSLASSVMDFETPMPPRSLSPLQKEGVRPCNVSELLSDLVGAVRPLALMQKRDVEFSEHCKSLQVAVEEPDLRQALSNLIEGALLRTHVGGKVEIASTISPAGGTLVIVEDDGPDMHYMTQMHSLTPFGEDLLSKNMVEDNMTWNFVAGLTIAREILESYGCVIRAISPRSTEVELGAGGTRIELWLPSYTESSLASPAQEV